MDGPFLRNIEMTPSNLKQAVQAHNPGGFYFSPRTMKFFGDTMKNYRVRTCSFNPEYWELWRKRPVNGGLKASHYFHKKTFNETSTPEHLK
jgi:hypothetical protein